MVPLQVFGAVVALLVAAREGRRGTEAGRWINFWCLVIALWAAEWAGHILFGLHSYTDGWWRPLGPVPPLAPLVWAAVITTAARLAGGRAVVAGCIVAFDLAVIGPVGIQSGLWIWQKPGLFDFPLEASVAWGGFAAGWVGIMDAGRTSPLWERIALALPVAFVGMLVMSAGLGWVLSHVDPQPFIVPHLWAVIAGWMLSAGVAWRVAARGHADPRAALERLPGAALVGALLIAYGHDVPPLVAFAAGALPPYLATCMPLWLTPRAQ
ncbi:MAG: hypothetical protein ACE366_20875 [Bradymonadia bacterium]